MSTHAAYPRAAILKGDCVVGDGANAAFKFLFTRGEETTERRARVPRGAHLAALTYALRPEQLAILEPRVPAYINSRGILIYIE